MNLIWMLKGWISLELTSAQVQTRLREFAAQTRLEAIELPDPLTARFRVCARDAEKLRICDGEELKLLERGGLPVLTEWLKRWRIAALAVVLLGILTVALPTRIWFLEVRGEGIPPALVLEHARSCGVYFGASRRSIRSEQVKNHLLWAIPELRWAGVNTEGCRAVITVSVRDGAEPVQEKQPGHIVAGVDAVVTELIPRSGTAQVSPGQAVKAGEILISGTTDLGHSILFGQADGEVFGLTRRVIRAVLPEETLLRGAEGRTVKKFSLRIGKKYVNFSNDSGILHGTCVKMRTVKNITLPGGFQLPVALVTDCYRLCQAQSVSREMDPGALLNQARRYAHRQMTAGVILSEQMQLREDGLTVVFGCRELIGVFRPGTTTEGDTNDRENRERGTG